MNKQLQIGMMYYGDPNHDTIDTKIIDAVQYYEKKYKEIPNLCHVHKDTCKKGKVANVKIIHDQSILPNYFWIGRA